MANCMLKCIDCTSCGLEIEDIGMDLRGLKCAMEASSIIKIPNFHFVIFGYANSIHISIVNCRGKRALFMC